MLSGEVPGWLLWTAVLGGLVLLTSFAKMAVVLSLLRNALGAPGVPSGIMIAGWATVLSVLVMAPVAEEVRAAAVAATEPAGRGDATQGEGLVGKPEVAIRYARAAEGPMKAFLSKHAEAGDIQAFIRLAERGGAREVSSQDWRVVGPAFVVSEFREALMLGLVLMLPFLVLDVVAGLALSILGLSNVPVTSVALPLKLLLFLVVDGWLLVSEGLVGGYFP